MRGTIRVPGSKHREEIGLALIDKYVFVIRKVDARSSGLPHLRWRVFIVGVRKDIAEAQSVAYFDRTMDNIMQHPLKPVCIAEILNDLDSIAPLPLSKRARKRLSKACIEDSRLFREKHGLPLRGSRHGHPYTEAMPRQLRDQLQPRQLELLDCATLWAAKHGLDLEEMIVDVSISLSRLPSGVHCDGQLITPTGNTQLVCKHTVLPGAVTFRLVGWPGGAPTTPPTVSDSKMRDLAGNMIAVPTIGRLLIGILRSFTLDPLSDFTPLQA